jgi:hypothetical protein
VSRVPVRAVAALAVTALVVVAGAATAGQRPNVKHGVVTLPTIDDAGSATTFPLHWAAPAGRAKALVVVFHGHTHNGDEWQAELNEMAARDQVVAVAPRTTETTEKNGKGTFDVVDEEARDAASAIAWSRRTHSKLPTYLLCVSMGCTGLAYFIDAVAWPRGTSADAKWVQKQHPLPITGIVVSEGLSNLVETWAEAGAADTVSQGEIEAETGGTPNEKMSEYRNRSLALLAIGKLHTSGIRTAAVVHDVDDGLVPFNQAVESNARLQAAGIPTHGYTIVGNRPGCSTEHETTFTSYVGNYVEDYTGSTLVKDNLDQRLCMAGHASETRPETMVMRTTFDVLHTMLTTGVGRGQSTVQPSS